MPWLIVIGDQEPLDWVLKNERMAFRDTVRTQDIEPGERFAIYVTRGAFRNPTRGFSQIVALGEFKGGIERKAATVAGESYARSARLSITATVKDVKDGLPFKPLVDKLAFIRVKSGWPTYVRRTLVSIPETDFKTIENAFKKKLVTDE